MKTKRILSAALALLLVVSLCAPAFAAGAGTLTAEGTSLGADDGAGGGLRPYLEHHQDRRRLAL